MKKTAFACACLLLGMASQEMAARISLPNILSSNMVLQQQTRVNLWGTSDETGYVEVKASWSSETFRAKIGNKGQWSVSLQTPSAGGPHTLTFQDRTEKQTLTNVLTGEVWLCSGQSNMEMPVKGFESQPVLGSTETIAAAREETPIRLFNVQRAASKTPMDDCVGTWQTHTPDAVASTSATAYFFGRQLLRSLGSQTPIGLIHTSWGGSSIEAWMSREALRLFPNINLKHLDNSDPIKGPNQSHTVLHNAMLHPLRACAIRGVIWYQGEANRDRAKQYEALMQNFVGELRQAFDDDELPFYYVQIAPFGYTTRIVRNAGTLLREAQLNAEATIPHSGMAVLMDIGDQTCIHPTHKQEVGERLAYMALHDTYKVKGIPAFSPRYASHKVEKNRMILTFSRAEMGLTSYGKPLTQFEIAGEDKVFVPAKASIIRGGKVQVWSETIPNPRHVRYAFKDYVVGDLFGVNGLPVSSFRTSQD